MTTEGNTAASEMWPSHLDALLAAPEFHAVLFENEHVRVLETDIPPGERTPVHTHRYAGVLYVISGTHFVRRDPDGGVLRDTRRLDPPFRFERVSWAPPLTAHSLQNVGDVPLHFIVYELKQLPAS